MQFKSFFEGYPTCQVLVISQMPGARTWHLNFQVPGALRQVTTKVGKWGIPEKGFQTVVQKFLFQVSPSSSSWSPRLEHQLVIAPIWQSARPSTLETSAAPFTRETSPQLSIASFHPARFFLISPCRLGEPPFKAIQKNISSTKKIRNGSDPKKSEIAGFPLT